MIDLIMTNIYLRRYVPTCNLRLWVHADTMKWACTCIYMGAVTSEQESVRMNIRKSEVVVVCGLYIPCSTLSLLFT
jgi:hypothetical protein